jgi:hypothetical protein
MILMEWASVGPNQREARRGKNDFSIVSYLQ